jgi:hypothetical protein
MVDRSTTATPVKFIGIAGHISGKVVKCGILNWSNSSGRIHAGAVPASMCRRVCAGEYDSRSILLRKTGQFYRGQLVKFIGTTDKIYRGQMVEFMEDNWSYRGQLVTFIGNNWSNSSGTTGQIHCERLVKFIGPDTRRRSAGATYRGRRSRGEPRRRPPGPAVTPAPDVYIYISYIYIICYYIYVYYNIYYMYHKSFRNII